MLVSSPTLVSIHRHRLHTSTPFWAPRTRFVLFSTWPWVQCTRLGTVYPILNIICHLLRNSILKLELDHGSIKEKRKSKKDLSCLGTLHPIVFPECLIVRSSISPSTSRPQSYLPATLSAPQPSPNFHFHKILPFNQDQNHEPKPRLKPRPSGLPP